MEARTNAEKFSSISLNLLGHENTGMNITIIERLDLEEESSFQDELVCRILFFIQNIR